MNLDFSGKTAIVTGAAHGFGRAISLAFAERGATSGRAMSSTTSCARRKRSAAKRAERVTR